MRLLRTMFLLLSLAAGWNAGGADWITLQEGFSGIPRFFGRVGERNGLKVDTLASGDFWNIIWVNETQLLTAGNTYRISLRYRLLRKEGEGGLAFVVRPGNVRSPSRKICIIERQNELDNFGVGYISTATALYSADFAKSDRVGTVHGKNAGFLHVDGHAAMINVVAELNVAGDAWSSAATKLWKERFATNFP